MDWIKSHGKSLTAVVFAALTVLAAALTDSHISSGEGLQIAVAGTTAVSVYLVPDLSTWPWAKAATAMVLAALNAAIAAIDGGITAAEWVGLGLAALGVIGVTAAPATVHLARPPMVNEVPYRT